MKQVKISEFKSRLSAHLREVRQGHEVIIMERDHPIAKVIPFEEREERLVVRPPRVKGGLKGLKLPPLRPIDVDVVKLLREDRNRR